MSDKEVLTHIICHLQNDEEGDIELAIEMLWKLKLRRDEKNVVVNECH